MKTVEVTEPGTAAFREGHLRDYWKVVSQGRWTLIAVFVVVFGAVAVWSFLQTPLFRATAIIEIQPKARQLSAGPDVSGMGAGGYGWYAEEKYHATQLEIIKSRDVAQRVVDDLGLAANPALSRSGDPVQSFRRRLIATPRRDTGLIEISMVGADPDQITRWVNAAARAYVARNLEKARANVNEAVDAIRMQMENLEDQLTEAETERFTALQDASAFGAEGQVEIVKEKLKTYNVELTQIQIELSQLEDTLDRVPRMVRDGSDLMALPRLSKDESLGLQMEKKDELERQLASSRVELQPDHPAYERLEKELSKQQQRIDEHVGRLLTSLKNEHDLKQEHEQFLLGQIDNAERFSREVARADSAYGLIKSKADAKRRILELFGKTVSEFAVGADLLSNNISLLDEAIKPRRPIKPRRKMNLAMGMMLGMFLGVAATFFLDYLDNTFRTPEDLERYLGVAVLGVIPKMAKEKALDNRAVRESYQSLRTSVIFSSKNRQRKVMLISSTGPQEGKSSTVANLGRTLAAGGDRVIIVDADLRRPTQHNVHEMDRDTGLTNYLTAPLDRTDWQSFTKTSEPSNLHIFTCGPIPPSPPELLGSERFTRLVESMRESYDWVLIDSPPAATLADASLLASLADMLILVVKHNHTDRDLVIKTLQRLRTVNKNVAGAVLNNVDLDRAYDKDYYYAAYYYYGDEGGEKRVRKRREPSAKKAKAG